MKTYLCITVDVEPDCSLNWHYSTPLAFTAVSEGVAEILHPLFLEYGIQPTYLINNVVLEDEDSISVFKNLTGSFELGTHLHSDFIEPDKVHFDYAGKDGVINQCYLDPEIEYGKLKNLTDLFVQRFGYYPVSFRAGRFSAGKNTMQSLINLNYKVDTSVTPHIIWKDSSRERPVDFTGAPDQPYWTDGEKFPQPSGNRKILQVPVSIVMARRYGFLKKPLWLRPFYSDAQELTRAAAIIANQNKKENVIVLNMMFHNVEVIPGLNPYTKSKHDVRVYLDSLKAFFEFCSANGIIPATLSEVYNKFSH